MRVKSRTSSQHVSMKLLVLVAVLIWTNVVVANSTREPVDHDRRLSVASVPFHKKWYHAFQLELTDMLNVADRNRISQDHVDKIAKMTKDFEHFPPAKQTEHLKPAKRKRMLLKMHMFDLMQTHDPKKKQAMAEETLKVLMMVEDFSIPNVVKVIHTGFVNVDPTTMELAELVELQLCKFWNSEGKSLGDIFKKLKLNEMKKEMDLYANPAFTTWMRFAFHLNGKDQRQAFESMLAVLKEEKKHWSNVKPLLKARANSKKENELFKKWDYVYSKRSQWTDISVDRPID